MHIIKVFDGAIMAIGFDMIKREPNPRMICWNDPKTGEWEAKDTNTAGYESFNFDVAPEFVRSAGRRVYIHQPGVCLVAKFIGLPLCWAFERLDADKNNVVELAA